LIYRNANFETLSIVAHRHDAHPHSPVVAIKQVASFMYTLDLSGRLVVWLPSSKEGRMCSLRGYSKLLQIPHRPTWIEVIDGLVYVTYRYRSKTRDGKKASLSMLEVYDVSGQQAKLLGEHEWEERAEGQPGRVTSACVVPSHRHYVFLGHE
jgi:hypothetical protein